MTARTAERNFFQQIVSNHMILKNGVPDVVHRNLFKTIGS